jgi:hypothetical protein
MRRLLAGALLVAAATPAAYADPAPLPTRTCTSAVYDQGLSSGTWHDVLYSRPVAATTLAPAGAHATITLTCTLHVFAWDGSGTADPAIEASATGTDVVVVPPVSVTYTKMPYDTVAVCARADVTGADGVTRTYYQSDDNEMWYETPAADSCDGWKCTVMGADCVYELALAEWLLDNVLPYDETESAACARLAALAPGVPGVVDVGPDGDVYAGAQLVWDCKPYRF